MSSTEAEVQNLGGAEEERRSEEEAAIALYVRTEDIQRSEISHRLTCLPPNPRSRKFPAMSLNSSDLDKSQNPDHGRTAGSKARPQRKRAQRGDTPLSAYQPLELAHS